MKNILKKLCHSFPGFYLLTFTLLVFNICDGQVKSSYANIKCDDSLWNHVYNSSRLLVIEKCRRVTGTVTASKFEADGDAHLLIKPDKGQENLLNKMNYKKQHGCLVAEPVCARKVKGDKLKMECAGYVNQVYIPRIGEHVEITGTFVLDKKHNWNEIHPVTKITRLKN